MNFKDYNINIDLSRLSGCAIATAINELGYANIHMCANHNDLLNTFTDEELIDHIINSKRDLSKYIFDFYMSEVVLNCENQEQMRTIIVKAMEKLYE